MALSFSALLHVECWTQYTQSPICQLSRKISNISDLITGADRLRYCLDRGLRSETDSPSSHNRFQAQFTDVRVMVRLKRP